MNMKLLYQTHSPYARKVLVMAHELVIAERIEVISQLAVVQGGSPAFDNLV